MSSVVLDGDDGRSWSCAERPVLVQSQSISLSEVCHIFPSHSVHRKPAVMDSENKPQGPSPHCSLYQCEIFKQGAAQIVAAMKQLTAARRKGDACDAESAE
ncbi:hypothetical protein BKA93DRAFT_876880 [Sparassis latifolia]